MPIEQVRAARTGLLLLRQHALAARETGMLVDIGVFACNDAGNISVALSSLTSQNVSLVQVGSIWVFSSSTDSTDSIVQRHAVIDKRIRLVKEKKRRGKAAAINKFLSESLADICVVMSADVVANSRAVEDLVNALRDDGVGIAGATVVPTNDPSKFFGFVSHLLWRLHARFEKVGEMVAFKREMVSHISDRTSVDEAYMQAIVVRKGGRVVRVPDAIVWNKGPENVVDFLKQRSRIAAGHISLANRLGFRVPTLDYNFCASALRVSACEISSLSRWSRIGFRKALPWFLLAAVLELFARAVGTVKLAIAGENPVWDLATTSKTPAVPRAWKQDEM